MTQMTLGLHRVVRKELTLIHTHPYTHSHEHTLFSKDLPVTLGPHSAWQ